MPFLIISWYQVPLCALFAILFVLGKAVYNILFHPLAAIPGPKLFAVSNIPYLISLNSGHFHLRLKEFHDQYGPVVRFTPDDVSFISATAWKEIYGHKNGANLNFQKDERLYRGSLTSAANILIANDADHSRMRRLLAHAFSEKALRDQEDLVQLYIEKFIFRLKERATKGQTVDMVKWFNFVSFDIIGDLAFGEPFGCLEGGDYHPWVAMIFSGFELAGLHQTMKRLPGWLTPLLALFIPKKLIQNTKQHFEMSHQKALKRVESGETDRKDFTSYILRHNDEKGVSPAEIGENANILIVAGSETTSTLLSGVLFWLLCRPEVYKTLVVEIRSMFKVESDITSINVTNCKYLLDVLQEGLRIYPPIPSGLGRVVSKGGAVVDDYILNEGSVVSVPNWVASHSESNFFDAENFIPERWQDHHPPFLNDNKGASQPFSFGPRNCLGKNLAYLEMRLILCRFLWNFDAKIMKDSLNWNEQKTFLLWKKAALNVKLTVVNRDRLIE